MPYITRSEFEKRFGEAELADLTDENYFSSRYALPLTTTPTIVTAWAADITRFKLWDDHAPEEVRRRYEDVLGQLSALAKGQISLPPGSDGNQAAMATAFAGYSAERVFTQDTLREF